MMLAGDEHNMVIYIKLSNVFARFEFVRGIGTDILPIGLQQNQDLTGKF